MERGVVKLVISGDTLIVTANSSLLGSPVERKKLERQISLNYIRAPKLARPPPLQPNADGTSTDEPFAFESREYLRKKLIGREIYYTVDIEIPQHQLLLCSVYLGNELDARENIVESLLKIGLVRLRRCQQQYINDPTYRRLVSIADSVKSRKLGIYSGDSSKTYVRTINWNTRDPQIIFDEHRHMKSVDAIVEFVKDGTTLRCFLTPTNVFATIRLIDIEIPNSKRSVDPVSIEPEIRSCRAKDYIEKNILQRDVQIVLDGFEDQNLFGRIFIEGKDLGILLLSEGLAKCVEWSMTALNQTRQKNYREAQKIAQDRCLGLWSAVNISNDVQDQTEVSLNKYKPTVEEYQGKVLEIIHGDALLIRDLRNDQKRKIYFSSVNFPYVISSISASDRLDSTTVINGSKSSQSLYEIPYWFDARELLRKSLIGRTVRVITDYIQKATQYHPEKHNCTVLLENKNVAEVLVRAGLAKIRQYGSSSNFRCSVLYNDLRTAEYLARKAEIGVFSKSPKLIWVYDLTHKDHQQGCINLQTPLKLEGPIPGIVESVITGSHFRIYLPTKNYIISFFISGISCPKPDRISEISKDSLTEENQSTRKLAMEALEFSRENFLQRDIRVQVKGVTKSGQCFGRIELLAKGSIGLILLQAGHARLHHAACDEPDYEQCLAAEKESKTMHRGLWKDYPTISADDDRDQVDGEVVTDIQHENLNTVVVTHVTYNLKFYVQYDTDKDQIEELQTRMNECIKDTSEVVLIPRRDQIIAACSFLDNQWYRARIEQIQNSGSILVQYLDYGNYEHIHDLMNRTRPLPEELAALPVYVHQYKLAYVNKYCDIQQVKNELISKLNKTSCLMNIEYCDARNEYVSLYVGPTKENILKYLCQQGLVIEQLRNKNIKFKDCNK